MLHPSCVVHGPIYGRFMGCTVNGFLSLEKTAAALDQSVERLTAEREVADSISGTGTNTQGLRITEK